MSSSLKALIAGNLRAERARSRIRQSDLAEALNLSRSQTSAIEAGEREITLSEALIVCGTLGITMRQLLHGADPADLETLGLA